MAKRRIPTDKEWFDYKENKHSGWLYCFMISSATFHEKIYYPKKDFFVDLPLIKKFLCVNDNRTINKYIAILKDNGYLAEDEENFYFPFVKNKGTYILIDKDLLYNLCVTKSTITTQIFVYLSNRLKMKKEQYGTSQYNFTIKEIRIALGYSKESQNARIEKSIKECLQTLKAENYIDYSNIYIDTIVNGTPQKIPNYQLNYITENIPQKLAEIKQKEFVF